jgi:hypothetical protein
MRGRSVRRVIGSQPALRVVNLGSAAIWDEVWASILPVSCLENLAQRGRKPKSSRLSTAADGGGPLTPAEKLRYWNYLELFSRPVSCRAISNSPRCRASDGFDAVP